jgi:hypothetical protein
MQKIIVLCAILTSIHLVFSQSRKDQIDQLNLQADSLKNVISEKSNAISNYQLQINQFQQQTQEIQGEFNTLEVKSTQLINELNHKIIQLTDTLKYTKELLSRYTENRNFSNGLFSEQQVQFIIEYFTNKLKIAESSNVVVKKANGDYIIQMIGELGYVSFYQFTPSYNPKFAGDLDNDGSFEILFQVVRSMGGINEWKDLYCLKFVPNSSYVIIELGIECPCQYSCGESHQPEIKSITSNKLIIKSACFKEDDAECCPSSEMESTYEFKNNQLFLKR